jgi:hypothetical protein
VERSEGQRAELVAREVLVDLVLGGQPDVFRAERPLGRADVEAARSRDHRERMTGRGVQHDGLQDLIGRDAQGKRLVDGV